MAQFNPFGTKEIVRPGLDFGPQRLPEAPSFQPPSRDIPGRGDIPEQTSIAQTTKDDFVNRPESWLGRDRPSACGAGAQVYPSGTKPAVSGLVAGRSPDDGLRKPAGLA